MTTLTYNPNETPEGELTAEEQDSLAVGEKATADQQELLAGKFRDAEELEKAYIELQKKFSSQPKEEKQAAEPTSEPEEVEEKEEESTSNILETLWEEGTKGEFTEDTLKELTSMSAADLAKLYLDYRSAVEGQQESSDEGGINDQQATELRSIAGGDKEYGEMMKWASEALSEKEIDKYDAVMATGDVNAMSFAVQALFAKYQDATGVEGELLTGKAAKSTKDVFRSQAEVVRAMSDPRYDNDPAYRQDVFAKLERSNLDY